MRDGMSLMIVVSLGCMMCRNLHRIMFFQLGDTWCILSGISSLLLFNKPEIGCETGRRTGGLSFLSGIVNEKLRQWHLHWKTTRVPKDPPPNRSERTPTPQSLRTPTARRKPRAARGEKRRSGALYVCVGGGPAATATNGFAIGLPGMLKLHDAEVRFRPEPIRRGVAPCPFCGTPMT